MLDALAVDDIRKRQEATPHRGIPRSVEEVGFAPLSLDVRAECRSRAGRLRAQHDFVRGVCIFCDAERWPQ